MILTLPLSELHGFVFAVIDLSLLSVFGFSRHLQVQDSTRVGQATARVSRVTFVFVARPSCLEVA